MKFSGLHLGGAGACALGLSLILLAGCSGGGGGGSGGSSNAPMFIQTCSLGCSSGQAGAQVSCALVSVHTNQDIAVYFSEPVDPSTLNANSLSVVDVNTGSIPPGLRLIDPLNPRKVIFRPSITFDAGGNASFGFGENRTYRIIVRGQTQGDPPPYIRSMGGNANQSRLQCEIQTTLGVVDLVPGNPTVDVRVDMAITATPNPNDTVPNVPAAGATDVWHNSTIRLSFNDVMNPATLAPNGTATFVKVEVDLDGDLGTTGDRIPLSGSYVVQQNTALLTTSMNFTASNGIPSSGDPLLNPLPRKIVVTIPNDLRDLAGNQLGNPQVVAFTPEYTALPAVILPDADGENFTDTANFDSARSGADWGAGKLTRGYGGGSGRLGELVIKGGQTVTLNTDSQAFPLASQFGHDILDNLQPGIDYPAAMPPALTVTDGIFEFTALRIETGGRLVLTGTKPARVFSRGSINLQGIIDVSGQTPAVHLSDQADGGAGGLGGPNGGNGGKGATRKDNGGNNSVLALPEFPAIDIDQTMITEDPNGKPGGGVGTLGTLAAGLGGIRNPDVFPTGVNQPALGTLTFSDPGGGFQCISVQVASPGGGGAYATDGGAAMPNAAYAGPIGGFVQVPTDLTGMTNLPPVTASGGFTSVLSIEPPGAPHVVRKLEAENGNLRGGAGGGGGGSSMVGTHNGAFPPCSGSPLSSYKDHSACGGGGGGGALQLVTGRTLTVSGLIDARGGSGGSTPLPAASAPPAELRRAGGEPGGAGAGGAVRLQSQLLDLTGTTQIRVDVTGGSGGSNFQAAHGGSGGAGLLRFETSNEVLVAGSEAAHIGPQDLLLVGPNAENILSVGAWAQPRRRPECFTGAMSCWMKPLGSFFQIVFVEDDPMNVDPEARYGWNMDVIYDTGGGPQLIKFRGPDPNVPFTPTMATPDFEAFLGNTLNHGVPAGMGSYLAVRFQGAQSVTALNQPCNVSLDPAAGEVLANSLTPWVRHPADLNDFNPRPNMVRFSVVFDTSLALVPNSIPSFIKGVTNLKIRSQPD